MRRPSTTSNSMLIECSGMGETDKASPESSSISSIKNDTPYHILNINEFMTDPTEILRLQTPKQVPVSSPHNNYI